MPRKSHKRRRKKITEPIKVPKEEVYDEEQMIFAQEKNRLNITRSLKGQMFPGREGIVIKLNNERRKRWIKKS